MFIENENLVEETTENVETATEETVEQIETPAKKTYNEEEVNHIVGKKLARNTAKLKREFEKKYGELENVLRAGTGKETVEEITDTFRDYYQRKGIQMSTTPSYSDRDIEVLAKAEADEIINAGFDEVVGETDRLSQIGYEKMTPRERAVFKSLAEHRQKAERGKELAKIGVTEDIYDSDRFKAFASKFNSSTPITEIYTLYNATLPKKEVRTMGSVTSSQAPKVKDFYTQEEIERLTDEDLDNEEVWNAVRRSMTGRS